MYRRYFTSRQDVRDVDQPGAFSKECKLLIDQILKFSYSEAQIYGEATEEVEKQDVSYRLLEQENLGLKNQVLLLEKSVQSKEVEINELKASISQLQCKQEEESRIEEISLPNVEQVIKRLSSTVEDMDRNLREQLKSINTTDLRNSESSKEKFTNIMTNSNDVISLPTDGIANNNHSAHCNLENANYGTFNGWTSEYFTLDDRLKQAMLDCNVLKVRNDYLEERVFDLENQLKQESSSSERCQRLEENTQRELLQCYKDRLYKALKEMTVKQGQIDQLNDSINVFVEKFKMEKSSLETRLAKQLRELENRLKLLFEDKVKLEETIRQQSKLIDYLQALVESKDKKPFLRINCL